MSGAKTRSRSKTPVNRKRKRENSNFEPTASRSRSRPPRDQSGIQPEVCAVDYSTLVFMFEFFFNNIWWVEWVLAEHYSTK